MWSIFSLLSPYATIIQLLAGSLYVIYFFDRRVEDPFQDSHDKIKEKYAAFSNRYQGSLTTEQRQHFKNLREKDESWWNNAIGSLSTLSRFSFIHCLLILFYISGEKFFLSNNYLLGLYVVSMLAFIYIILIMFMYGQKNKVIDTLRSTFSLYFFFGVCVMLFLLIQKINSSCIENGFVIGYISQNAVYFLILFICFEGLVCRLLANLYHAKALSIRYNVLNDMQNQIDSISYLLNNASATEAEMVNDETKINLLTQETKNEILTICLSHKNLTIAKAIELTNKEISHIYAEKMQTINASTQLSDIFFTKRGISFIILLIAISILFLM